MAKTSKRSAGDNKPKKKNNKKMRKTGPNAVAMKLTAPKANPFESIWSRRKFDILGKKRKGEELRVGHARSRAIDKRKKTLLKEYQQSGKSSVFVDKRIGENNDELGEFDKALMRSQRDRQLKLNKKSKYNLSDGEEDDFPIASLGPLSGQDDFEDEMLSDDDKYNAEMDDTKKKAAILKHYGGHDLPNSMEQEGEEHTHKSKKEVMQEVILKSKFFKAEKAKEKEANERLMEELDKDFTSLVQSNALLSLTEPGKMNALKALVKVDIPKDYFKKEDNLVPQKQEGFNQDQSDSYDKLVKELILERRARPSERTKTDEEIAQEERERLERLEEDRQKRMHAVDDDDNSDEENDDVDRPLTQRPRSLSGDALGDSFSLDEEPRVKKGWVDEILERKDGGDSEIEDDDSSEDLGSTEDNGETEDSDEENDDEDNTVSLKDWEQSDDDNLGPDLEEDEEENYDSPVEDKQAIETRGHKNDAVATRKGDGESSNAKKVKAKEQHSTKPDIPYLIEAPKSFEELNTLLENCSSADVMVVINRIRASNAIKLAAENRKKMQVFYGLLLQYFAVIANKKPINFELMNVLVKPLMEISAEIPYFSAICARQRIMRTRAQFCEAIKNMENGSWPSLKTLSLLRLWSMIFPGSDFRHVVMTPAMLLMSEYLLRCPILSGRDVAIGSFLCSMVFSVAKQSQKFCPEAINFLRTLLMAAIDKKLAYDSESQFYHLMELKTLRPLLCVHDRVTNINPLNFLMVMDMAEDCSFFSSDDFRSSVLFTIIETLKGFVDIYEKLSSFPEIFLPISTLLLEVAKQEKLPNELRDNYRDVAQLIKKKADEHHTMRQPLQIRKQKPVPIRLLAPKFEENYVKGRDYDPDRERAERRKQRKLIKQEARGAKTELRKDNYFLSEAKEKDKALMEAEKAEKYGKALAFLQEQEHAFKSGQLGKGNKRRR